MAVLPAVRPRLGGLWRHPDFVRLWAGQATSTLGSQVSALAIPLTAVLLLDATASQMGLLQAARTVPIFLFGLFAGVWARRRRCSRRCGRSHCSA